MQLPKIKILRQVPTLRSHIESSLRTAIVSGQFKPGERLAERELCELLSVSRTSVREALRQVEAEGLVNIIPHRGPVVAAITLDEAKQLYQVRELLEAFAGRNFAENAADEDVEELKAAVDAFASAAQTSNRSVLIASKTRFYAILMNGAGNVFITQMLTQLHNRITILRVTSMTQPGRLKDSVREIRAILNAIKRRDGQQAYDACRKHIANAAQIAVAVLEKNNVADGIELIPGGVIAGHVLRGTMDTTSLRSFLMIAECGSITEASSRLGIAQPSLSHQLLRLEDELKAKLFRRTTKGVRTTEAGLIFEQRARNILSAIDLARKDVMESTNAFSGDVSVALPTSASEVLGVPLILAVKKAYPNLKFILQEAMSGHIRKWVDDGVVDLAVLFDAKDLRHLSIKPLLTEQLCLVGKPGEFGPPDRRGLASVGISLREIEKLRLIMPSRQHGLRQFVERVMPGVEANIYIEADSLSHIKTLIAGGHGNSILSLAAVYSDLAAGRLSAARLKDKGFTRSLNLVRNPGKLVTRASIGVEDILTSLVRSMSSQGFWCPAISDFPTDLINRRALKKVRSSKNVCASKRAHPSKPREIRLPVTARL